MTFPIFHQKRLIAQKQNYVPFARSTTSRENHITIIKQLSMNKEVIIMNQTRQRTWSSYNESCKVP